MRYNMKSDLLIHESIRIITEYYMNNLQPFFDCLADDVLWLGPTEGQILRGRQNIIDTFSSEMHELTFTMGSIDAVCVTPCKAVREVLLHYDIYTHYPSSNTDLHDQRLQFTWREKRIKTENGYEPYWEVVMIHISNAWRHDSRDTIYPVHYENVALPIRLVEKPDNFITVKADDMSVHRIATGKIIYIETIKRTAKLCIHTSDSLITINGTLPDFESRYSKYLLRIHASYLINPEHVTGIERFSVTLSDGTILPVPEKKYTAVKKALLSNSNYPSG